MSGEVYFSAENVLQELKFKLDKAKSNKSSE